MTTTALSSADLYWVARYRCDGFSYSRLGEMFSVSPETIRMAHKQLLEGSDGPYCRYRKLFDEELGTEWRSGDFPKRLPKWEPSKIQRRVEDMCRELGWNFCLGVDNTRWYLFPKGKQLRDLRGILGEDFGSFGTPNLDIAESVASVFIDARDVVDAFDTLLEKLGPVYRYNGWTLNWC